MKVLANELVEILVARVSVLTDRQQTQQNLLDLNSSLLTIILTRPRSLSKRLMRMEFPIRMSVLSPQMLR